MSEKQTPVKVTFEYDLTEEEGREAFKTTAQARSLELALWDIAQELFRPARKHGYPGGRMADLIDHAKANGYDIKGDDVEYDYNIVNETVEALEKMFYEILEERKVEID